MDSVNGTEIVETSIFLSSEWDVVTSNMEILFTVTDDHGRILVLSKRVQIPISLFYVLIEDDNNYDVEIVIMSSNNCLDLIELYSGTNHYIDSIDNFSIGIYIIYYVFNVSEYEKEDYFKNGCTSNKISLCNRASKNRVCINACDNVYVIKGRDYADIISILENLDDKLHEYYRRRGETYECRVKLDKEHWNVLIHSFLKYIEIHAKSRLKHKNSEVSIIVIIKLGKNKYNLPVLLILWR